MRWRLRLAVVPRPISCNEVASSAPRHRGIAPNDSAAIVLNASANASVAWPDEITQRLRPLADCWREIAFQSDYEASELVRRDRIDILVDLAGHIGGNRLMVFARKPAPIQVTYIGYQNTTGMLAMDYRLTDDGKCPKCAAAIPGRWDAAKTRSALKRFTAFDRIPRAVRQS